MPSINADLMYLVMLKLKEDPEFHRELVKAMTFTLQPWHSSSTGNTVTRMNLLGGVGVRISSYKSITAYERNNTDGRLIEEGYTLL